MEENKKTLIVRSIRAEPEVFENLKKITSDMDFENQGAALSAIVAAYERDKASKAVPGLKNIIEELSAHQNAIGRIFNELLEQNVQKEAVVREEIQLEIGRIRHENERLKKELEEEKQLRWNAMDKLESYKETVEDLKHQLQEEEELNKTLRNALDIATKSNEKKG